MLHADADTNTPTPGPAANWRTDWHVSRPETWPMCTTCGKRCEPGEKGLGTGYGVDKNSLPHCYACCGEADRQRMLRGETIGLYLVKREGRYVVVNWPGTLAFPTSFCKSWRGWGFGGGYPVRQAWFRGPDGKRWTIRVQGDMECGTARRTGGDS